MDGITRRVVRATGLVLGLVLTFAACVYLTQVVSLEALGSTVLALATDPVGVLLALCAYAGAFGLRAWAWRQVLPTLSAGHAWAALHVSLLGNHVLPLRLGEALRVTSVVRRTSLPLGPALASAVTLRMGDLLAVVALALLGAPALVVAAGGAWTWLMFTGGGIVLVIGLAVLLRLRRSGAAVRLPGALVALSALGAWVLEAAVVFEVARVAGVALSPFEAVAVTAVTIAAQAVAVTPGGFGTYEAAGAAAMAAAGVDPGQAVAVAFTTHAVKTAYSLLLGVVALAYPAPTYFGRLRLPRQLPPRPAPRTVDQGAPVVAILPVYNEAATIGDVVGRLPRVVDGRPVVALVIDDGSTDGSGEVAAQAGATVIGHSRNLGVGAAVRRGLTEATSLHPAAVVYLDADLEYEPTELTMLAHPVLKGTADYVVGSRFAGRIRSMRPHRRVGNRALTVWVRWMARRRDLTDGQSGYRAFSPAAAAAAEIVHDYNYAQVLTLDLLGKGFRYAEVPITYAYRTSGTSFVTLGRYLRKVLPAVHRELNRVDPMPAAEPVGSSS